MNLPNVVLMDYVQICFSGSTVVKYNNTGNAGSISYNATYSDGDSFVATITAVKGLGKFRLTTSDLVKFCVPDMCIDLFCQQAGLEPGAVAPDRILKDGWFNKDDGSMFWVQIIVVSLGGLIVLALFVCFIRVARRKRTWKVWRKSHLSMD